MTNMDDTHLDTLFTAARRPTAGDEGAAERFFARRAAAHRRRVGGLVSAALAAAAVTVGVLTLQPAELPASAAYEVYSAAQGSDW